MIIKFVKDLEMFSTEGIQDSTIIVIGFVEKHSIGLKAFRTDYDSKYQFVSMNGTTGYTGIIEGYPRKLYSYRFVFRSYSTLRFGTFIKSKIILIKKIKDCSRDDIVCLTPEETEKRLKERC